MQKRAGKAAYGLRWGVFSLITAIAVVSVTTDPADARARRGKKKAAAAASSYTPPYSDIVVDANTGAVLHDTNPDALRHPASLTKIMTLYMLFQQLEAGKITFRTELPVSAHAAAQAPSKLNLKPGDSIAVEDAIKAIVTKSANDVAVVIAEALGGGSEEAFCDAMTAKAHALGMEKTVYKNASGLPDDRQITTARDQALLGRLINERFPKYYAFFSTPRFYYRGNTIGNHNRLLARVEGVDGIKTGYTNASGFNLVTSMRREGRHVVAVVLGGRSASSRDEKMRSLITDYIRVASAKRTAPVLAENAPRSVTQKIAAAVITPARAEPAPAAAAAVPLPRPAPAAVPVQVAAAAVETMPAAATPGSNDPIAPIAVRTLQVKPGVPVSLSAPAATASIPPAPKGPELAFADPGPGYRQPGSLGTMTVKHVPAPAPAPAREPMQAASLSKVAPEAPRAAPAAAPHPPGWMIQVGAFDREDEAKTRLSAAQARARSFLADASGFLERVQKGEKTFYRARFAGLGKEQAEAACKYLKKNEIACMSLKN
jgi:D-alanyl-D-alanine carboxypeptidase